MSYHSIRVIIADDHPIIRAGVRATLSAHPQIQVVGEAASFSELLGLLETIAAHVLILDLVGLGVGPISMVDRLQRDYPRLAIVVFSSVLDLAPDLLAAGALGYLLKDEIAEQLAGAVQAAHRGERRLSPAVSAHLRRSERLREQVQLTLREQYVLRLLARGLRTEEIAAQLSIDPRTAQNHITALLRKTGSPQRADLIAWYRREVADSR
jgi:two-component system, NarL family, response regulator LiaR